MLEIIFVGIQCCANNPPVGPVKTNDGTGTQYVIGGQPIAQQDVGTYAKLLLRIVSADC